MTKDLLANIKETWEFLCFARRMAFHNPIMAGSAILLGGFNIWECWSSSFNIFDSYVTGFGVTLLIWDIHIFIITLPIVIEGGEEGLANWCAFHVEN